MRVVNIVYKSKKRRERHFSDICLYIMLSILTLALPVYAAKSLNASNKLPLKVYASVDKSKVTIGDRITYTITVKADKDIEVKLPELAHNAGKFTVSNFGSSQKRWFKTKTYRKWYVLNTYTSGRYSIPPSLIKYRKRGRKKWEDIYTNKVVVNVASVLDNARDKRDIRGIAGPIGFPVKISWYVYLIILLAVGVIATLFYIKNRKKKEIVIPPRPAYEIAYEALEELKRKKYLEDHKFNLYYVELSNIVRKYLENRFKLRATEMTTEEFLNNVKDNNTLSHKHKKLLRDFLLTCDLVKFAKYEPYDKEADLSFNAAKNLIDQTKTDSNL